MTVQTAEQKVQQKKERLKWLRDQYHKMEKGATSKEDSAALKLRGMELQMRLDAMEAR